MKPKKVLRVVLKELTALAREYHEHSIFDSPSAELRSAYGNISMRLGVHIKEAHNLMGAKKK